MNYRFIDHAELLPLIQKGIVGKDYAIVDVRDHDFEGGNIPGAINAPSEEATDQSVAELVQKLEGVPKVIFHCALSQVRGPKAARIYADALAASKPPPLQSSSRADTKAFSPNPFVPSNSSQDVLVLRDGFEGWQSLYRNDPKLVEKFDEKIWGAYAQ